MLPPPQYVGVLSDSIRNVSQVADSVAMISEGCFFFFVSFFLFFFFAGPSSPTAGAGLLIVLRMRTILLVYTFGGEVGMGWG